MIPNQVASSLNCKITSAGYNHNENKNDETLETPRGTLPFEWSYHDISPSTSVIAPQQISRAKYNNNQAIFTPYLLELTPSLLLPLDSNQRSKKLAFKRKKVGRRFLLQRRSPRSASSACATSNIEFLCFDKNNSNFGCLTEMDKPQNDSLHIRALTPLNENPVKDINAISSCTSSAVSTRNKKIIPLRSKPQKILCKSSSIGAQKNRHLKPGLPIKYRNRMDDIFHRSFHCQEGKEKLLFPTFDSIEEEEKSLYYKKKIMNVKDSSHVVAARKFDWLTPRPNKSSTARAIRHFKNYNVSDATYDRVHMLH